MDRELPARHSTRPTLMRWWPRLLIALVLVVGYAFCYFVVPKIEASWTTPGPRGCSLRLMPSVTNVSGIPTAGDSLVIVANVDHAPHFRIFDGHGNMVVDTDETKLPQQAQRIEDLKKQLEGLWPPQKPTGSERVQVNADVTSIVGYTWLEPPRWVPILGWLSHFFVRYVPAILLVPAAWDLGWPLVAGQEGEGQAVPASVRPEDRSRHGCRFRGDYRPAQRLVHRPLPG